MKTVRSARDATTAPRLYEIFRPLYTAIFRNARFFRRVGAFYAISLF